MIKLLSHHERLIITTEGVTAAHGHFRWIETPHYEEHEGSEIL